MKGSTQPLSQALKAAATLLALAPFWGGSALAYDVNEQLSINALLAGAYQCQEISGPDDVDNTCRGGLPVQPEVFYNPTKHDQFFLKLGFAAGNGLNPVSPFVLAPWAADLEDDVRDINGRDRSYLLEAWYAHTFALNDHNSIQLTGGIIDPAFYVNENAYANNEYTQFMNEAFVNNRNVLMPAYDVGAVLVWKVKDWTFSVIGMNVGENDDGENYNWYTAEADYHIETPWGAGNYRLMYAGTSRAFLDVSGELRERLKGLSLSFDQELGPVFGVFLRLGWQSEDAAVDYKGVYTGGLDIKGGAWGREKDNIGIAYGYLDGGNLELSRTDVFEAYYRLALNDFFALTADAQYMSDGYRGADNIAGWVLGLRAVAEF